MTNTVRYTPAEIKAITSGMSDGISVINCPPGSNKQQVALQIIANLPNSTTLILSAANQIPALISKLEQFVPSRSILHLDRELDDLDLPHESLHGRQGRVNLFLAERLAHLDYVKRLAASLGIQGAFGENITNAMFFFKHHVQPLWQDFQKTLRKKSLEPIINTFPFMSFFNEGPQGDPAAQCRRLYASMEKVFHSLENMIVFELVKSTKDRSTYVLVKEARVIILSPEYISKVYREFRSLGVPIDSICVLDGDELAIVQSAALCTQVRRCIVMCLSRFKETAALDSQSVYPTSIYNVFRSVYNIQDVGQPRSSPAPKFVYDSQFVHVPTKATSIRADWVQNLDQAEFLVQTFMFMVKNGYR